MFRHRTLLVLWLLSDLLVFAASYCSAYFLQVGPILSTDFVFGKFFAVTLVIAPIWLLVLGTTRTFALTRNQATIRNAAYIAYSCLVGIALFTVGYYFTYKEFFSRMLLVYAFILSVGTTLLWHIIWEYIQRSLLRRDPPAFPTLLVGVTRESRTLLKTMNTRRSALKPVAILDGRGVKDTTIEGVPVLGKLNKLEETLERFKITHLIQGSDLEQSLNLLSACRNRGITYIVLPSVFGIVERDESVESLEGIPVTVVRPRSNRLGWFLR
ncbi:MAG: Undecaprenyl-phosphate glucose phosphotransferase [Candidatus Peregrinibacteria bacterium Greene1014_49]|nr:MAG: Undecaprenyl-phosphate glucose phosphotransferase [Candidatus Peregrinibacteria bacterium Greene1014_49]